MTPDIATKYVRSASHNPGSLLACEVNFCARAESVQKFDKFPGKGLKNKTTFAKSFANLNQHTVFAKN